MQDDTKKRSGKTAAILCAAVVIAILGIYLAAILYPLLGAAWGEGIAVGILIVYGLLIAAVIVGVIVALGQRLREIEGGEEENARKY